MLDERQYRDDQPCGDAIAPPCRELGPRRATPRRGASSNCAQAAPGGSDAAWKVIGGQSLMMPNRVHDGEY